MGQCVNLDVKTDVGISWVWFGVITLVAATLHVLSSNSETIARSYMQLIVWLIVELLCICAQQWSQGMLEGACSKRSLLEDFHILAFEVDWWCINDLTD